MLLMDLFCLCLTDALDGKRPAFQPSAVRFMVKKKPGNKEQPKIEDTKQHEDKVESSCLQSLCQYDSDDDE